MKQILVTVLAALLLAGCGQSYEEQKRVSRQQRLKALREDSAALKVAVLPTLDCLPLYVAQERGFFQAQGADIRLKRFTAQMDCDTALERGRVEGAVTDLVRAERISSRHTPLRYVAATNAYWQLITSRMARVKQLKQLDDKMVAMTRYSVTDMLCDLVVDSAKLKTERVFRIQVNDVNVRLKMLLNNEMDAELLTEPQATQARKARHQVVLDTRKLDMQMGVIAFREQVLKDTTRQRQLDVFTRGYDQACDSLNKWGVAHYRDILVKYYGLQDEVIKVLPKDLRFSHASAPREADVERAKAWWETNKKK